MAVASGFSQTDGSLFFRSGQPNSGLPFGSSVCKFWHFWSRPKFSSISKYPRSVLQPYDNSLSIFVHAYEGMLMCKQLLGRSHYTTPPPSLVGM